MDRKKKSPFDITKSISSKTKNEYLSGDIDKSEINPFMTCQILSAFEDCVLIVDEFNARPDVPQEHLFTALHSLITPKRNRFSKFVKPAYKADDEEINEYMSKNEVGWDTAVQCLSIEEKLNK